MSEQFVDIGKYRISRASQREAGHRAGKVWLTVIEDGEGMEADVAKLEAVLERFYEAEF